MTMTTFCLTFGQKYWKEPHPSGHPITPDGWVEIETNDIDIARNLANETFGATWSYLYWESQFEKEYFPAGCLMRLKEKKP